MESSTSDSPSTEKIELNVAGADQASDGSSKVSVIKDRQVTADEEEGGNDRRKGKGTVDPARYQEVEKQLIKKTDIYFLPLVAGIYLCSFLDRSNIGNARLAGMQTELGMTGNEYEWLLSIYYIAYAGLQLQALMWKVIPAHIWGAYCVFAWGLASTLQATTHNWNGMMALRFLMGMFEAGYNCFYLLSFYYVRSELGFRFGCCVAAAPLANTFAGALAYGITSAKHPPISNWRILFIVEGIPSMAVAVVTWFCLPDAPEKARFLNEEEKEVAKTRGISQSGKVGTQRLKGIEWKGIYETFMDLKCWAMALAFFAFNVSFSSLPVFLPTILNEMGFTALASQGLTAPPFFVAFFITLLACHLSDRFHQRAYFISTLAIVAGTGYVLLATVESVAIRYFGVFLASAGIYPAMALTSSWLANNQNSDTRRGVGLALLNGVGQCGSFLGTRTFPSTDSPRFTKGQSISAGCMFFASFVIICLRGLYILENRKLDGKYGKINGSNEGGKQNEPKRNKDDGKDLPMIGHANDVRTGKEEGYCSIEGYGPRFRYML